MARDDGRLRPATAEGVRTSMSIYIVCAPAAGCTATVHDILLEAKYHAQTTILLAAGNRA